MDRGLACLLSPARKQRLMSCRLVHAGRRDRLSLHILFQLAYGWASPEIGPRVGVTGCTSLVSMTARLAYWALPERQGPRMARKPKPASSTEASAAVAGLELPNLDEAPVPTRRGRPPKSAEVPLLPATAEDSGDTTLDVADAAATGADDAGTRVGDSPFKKRQGRKARSPASAVATPLSRGEPRRAQGQQGRRPGDAELAAEPEDAVPLAEMVHVGELSANSGGSDRNAAEGKPAGGAAPSSVAPVTIAALKPAARWDRATDTVQFDWPEIEQAASRDGPNQAMAKLLVAARAEGADSRWPL